MTPPPFQDDDHTLLMHVWEAQEHLNERMDTINARFAEMALHPPPSPTKESLRLLQALVATSITVALASLGATITAIGLLVSHIAH